MQGLATGEAADTRVSDEDFAKEVGRLMQQSLMTDEQIAAICHEANKAFCEYLGDFSQPGWAEAPDWQRSSAIQGVGFHRANPEASDSASHDNWMAVKRAEGWIWGAVKDTDLKMHPCMVTYEALPPSQRFKDKLFRTIVHAALKGA